MTEYIEREAAIEETRKPRLTDAELRRRLSLIPAADVRPVVRGNWTIDGKCSVCGEEPLTEFDVELMNFCPNCGTDMREVKNG